MAAQKPLEVAGCRRDEAVFAEQFRNTLAGVPTAALEGLVR